MLLASIVMRALILFFFASSTVFAEDTKLFQCYSRIAVRGRVAQIDSAIKKVSSVYTVYNQLHVGLADGSASIETIIGVTGTDRDKLVSMLADDWVKKYSR